MLELQSFLSGRLPTWACQLPHSKMEGGDMALNERISLKKQVRVNEVLGRAQTRRHKIWVQSPALPMGLLGGFLIQRKT